jgi:hypothetical protein
MLDTIIPVVIVGDFNISDIHLYQSTIALNQDDINHYNNTIRDLTDAGLSKLEYSNSESNPFTFHSWNSISKSKTLDYILWSDPNDRLPEISNLTPGPFNADESTCLCPSMFSINRYLTDHNGIVLDYNIFGI